MYQSRIMKRVGGGESSDQDTTRADTEEPLLCQELNVLEVAQVIGFWQSIGFRLTLTSVFFVVKSSRSLAK